MECVSCRVSGSGAVDRVKYNICPSLFAHPSPRPRQCARSDGARGCVGAYAICSADRRALSSCSGCSSLVSRDSVTSSGAQCSSTATCISPTALRRERICMHQETPAGHERMCAPRAPSAPWHGAKAPCRRSRMGTGNCHRGHARAPATQTRCTSGVRRWGLHGAARGRRYVPCSDRLNVWQRSRRVQWDLWNIFASSRSRWARGTT